eukprot:5742643-Alexandrium_andersonii.AAC.1
MRLVAPLGPFPPGALGPPWRARAQCWRCARARRLRVLAGAQHGGPLLRALGPWRRVLAARHAPPPAGGRRGGPGLGPRAHGP